MYASRELNSYVYIHSLIGYLQKTHNTVIRDHDPTATAEINAIREVLMIR